jgi:hypothetical protein
MQIGRPAGLVGLWHHEPNKEEEEEEEEEKKTDTTYCTVHTPACARLVSVSVVEDQAALFK